MGKWAKSVSGTGDNANGQITQERKINFISNWQNSNLNKNKILVFFLFLLLFLTGHIRKH